MKNHTHAHGHDKSAAFEPAHPERFAAARKSTWVSIVVNLFLTLAQLIGGFFGKSQSLMADGLHSLSDLLADIMVLFANRHGNKHADANHPYGHARIETAASLILGVSLVVVGGALLISAGMRLQHPEEVHRVEAYTFWVALFTLAAKETLFRYMLAVAKRVRSQMLVANAWHARSDAASSLVVLIGISGNLLGYTFLDLVAAAVVSVMIAWMGIQFARDAMLELVDTGLEAEEVRAIRNTLKSVPGVLGLHELRTRKMADNALVDAHIMVDPYVSVSEGHYIAEAARAAVLRSHHVMDVMVHIDPEDDVQSKPNAHTPQRHLLLVHLHKRLAQDLPADTRIVLHYLNGKIEAELLLPATATAGDLQAKCDAIVTDDPYFKRIDVYQDAAPK
ncbi:MAG: cation diffusion facilitator family transporter [Gammaproteobacteria bacterium]|nr:cation transporter [Sideroxydans sp.]MBU3902756.1 cation diffusion facilitator family transporter [Gammaproteobacteria bacterium]MBU4045706.1 cation diffusion facilitator family transporter [Gammaproteobacteria bacterium]